MELWNLREIAAVLGVDAAGMDKVEVVRAIQRAEGEVDCFGRAEADECDQEDCMWREDCFAEAIVDEKTA